MLNTTDTSSGTSIQRLERILTHALTDPEFRRQLLDNASVALADEQLSAKELHLLSGLRRDELEASGVDVKPFRSFLRTDGHKC
jgi:hypothetical protein